MFEARCWEEGVIKIPVARLIGKSKDPAPGKSKSLQLTCSINGQTQTFTGTDGADIEIDAKPEQVRVLKARYGVFPDGPTLDLTTAAGTLVAMSTLAETDIPSLNVLMMKTTQGEWIDLTAEVRKAGWAKVADKAQIPAGRLRPRAGRPANRYWPDIHRLAETISKRHTVAGGHRSLDVLHVATALHLGAREFLTFDANQRQLAVAEKLKVKP